MAVSAASAATWICTEKDQDAWVDKSAELQGAPSNAKFSVKIDPAKTAQTIDGFGGSFNEMGWGALQCLTQEQRDEVMEALFGESGCRFNICRMAIGSSDFSYGYYSLNDTPNDYEMKHFDLSRDRVFMLPYIKAATAVNPDLEVWGSPWCPPKWMKKSGIYKGAIYPHEHKEVGEMRWEPEVLNALSLYFEKYIRAYRDEGVNVTGIHVQNEPWAAQKFPSCLWVEQELAEYIRDYLGPHFEKAELDAEIWYGTINHAPYDEAVKTAVEDPECMQYITGFGFQWAGAGLIGPVNALKTGKKLMATETVCGRGKNDWSYAWTTAREMRHYFANGANSYMQWNMVLDVRSKSYWGWPQNSMITVMTQSSLDATHDRPASKAPDFPRYNPQFQLVKHITHFVDPGAKYLPVSDRNCMAFVNPDGKLVVVYFNDTDELQAVSFDLSGEKTVVEIPAQSINTLVF